MMMRWWNRLSVERQIATAYLGLSLLSIAGIVLFGQSAILEGIDGRATNDEIFKEIVNLAVMFVVAGIVLWIWPTGFLSPFLTFFRQLALPRVVWAVLAVDFVVSNVLYRYSLLLFLSGLVLAGVLAGCLAVSWVRDRGSEHDWRFSRWQREPVGAGFRRIHVLAAAVFVFVILPLGDLDRRIDPVVSLLMLIAVVYVGRRVIRDAKSRATVT